MHLVKWQELLEMYQKISPWIEEIELITKEAIKWIIVETITMNWKECHYCIVVVLREFDSRS